MLFAGYESLQLLQNELNMNGYELGEATRTHRICSVHGGRIATGGAGGLFQGLQECKQEGLVRRPGGHDESVESGHVEDTSFSATV